MCSQVKSDKVVKRCCGKDASTEYFMIIKKGA
jgi:hypothetical protein